LHHRNTLSHIHARTHAPSTCNNIPPWLRCLCPRRVVEYEARAGAALQQALSEEERVAKAREAASVERASVAAAHNALQVWLGPGLALPLPAGLPAPNGTAPCL
jgi:hypothetical protein